MLKIIHINNYSKSTVSKLVIISNNCNFSQKSNLDEKQTEHKHNVIKNSGKEPAKVPSANSSEWRSPVHKEDASQNRMLNMFNSDQNSIKFLKWLQQPIDLRPATIKKWWLRISDEAEEEMQRYNPNRHQALGPELACAHFIVYRGGAIKFHNNDKWIKAVDKEYTLPLKYSTGLFLQSIDCTGMNLRYEGLSNLRGLQNVQWLSLNGS
ncbi:hypothetical protein ABEB36_000422 [Hypothenemus hampei]|uniref:Uncharacterized protein n=1 Tax=Hypothenemus hampei TaxID=57062 RepID=A0ABD1FB47_HYPHA